MNENELEQQFTQAGIMPFYYGYGGEIHAPFAIRQALYERLKPNTGSERFPLPYVKVFSQNQPHFLSLQNRDGSAIQGQWQLQLESGGTQLSGLVENNAIELPSDLPLGYHQLSLNDQQCRIIIAPTSCYQPPALQEGKKLWGSFIQLYTLKSEQNWGIGDFTDLKQFIQHLAPYQADFLGLNPIHALFPANPQSASPYSPSSRKWLNIAYIDVSALAEFQQNPAAQEWFNSQAVQQTLSEVRSDSWINYGKIIPLKLQGLRFAFDGFKSQQDPQKQQEFAAFVANGGESLQIQATFDALHAHLAAQFSEQWGWDFWAQEYQHYHCEAVQQFSQKHADDVQFYMWLQFVADSQLAECDALCHEKQMTIGLYRDLAVGVTGNGSETWNDKTLYCLEASVGAPSDMLAPQGQNWGLTPMNPHVLQQRAYDPIIQLIRSNMQHCGALRIDHIMSLLRLWWVPKGESAINGAYVRYPVDDLIAILALESQRHQCLIIGEDLGIVPQEIIGKLYDAGILSYKVVYFESDHNGKSRDLQDYPYQAMTTLSTHDLPTIRGYWCGRDFELGQQFHIYPSEEVFNFVKNDRYNVKARLLERLAENHIDVEQGINETLQSDFTKHFNHQLQKYVSNVSSALFGFQPEDWLDMSEPVNIPGTSTEYPNWRRRLSISTNEMFADSGIQELLSAVNNNRKN